MYYRFFRLIYLSCFLVFLPLLAKAELSTREVWDNLKKLLETGGYQVIGQEVSVGSDLSIKNVQIFFEVDNQTNIIFDIKSMNLSRNSDGFIYVSLPEEIYVQYLNEDEFGYETEANILVRARELEFKVSGTLSEVLYELTASSAGFVLVELLNNGVPASDFSAQMEFVLTDINSKITSTGGSTIEVKSLLSASGASIKGGVSLLSIPLEVNFQYVMDQFKSSSVSSEPKVSLDEDLEQALAKGFSATSNFNFDTSEMSLNATTPGGPLSILFATGPSSLTTTISQSGFSVQSDNEKSLFNLSLPSNGSDFELDFQEFSTSLNIPLLAKSGEQDFGMSLKLSGLNFSDAVWDLFDAGNLMPNDPASIEFSLEGSTILDEGLTREAIIENQNLGPLEFGKILRFKLKEFLLSALGISVEANGNFEFDNSDLETFQGIPRPMGTASLQIKGSNTFIDRLEDMQVFPSETIMGARMMLALIMRASGDDILSSEFEIDEKGKIYANGQRLR
jgi:hypothetical protein